MIHHILIANRGEVALRIAQAAADMGLLCTAVFATDEAGTAHRGGATRTVPLGAPGPAAYLDINRLLALARDAGCDAVHPGYGFLSERADFAQACADAGLVFIGPTAAQLAAPADSGSLRAPMAGRLVRFAGVTYAERYELLCRRWVLERLYSAACFLTATNTSATVLFHPAEDLSFGRFSAALRGHASLSWAVRPDRSTARG